MGMNVFDGGSVSPKVISELRNRASTSINQWHAAKTAWVHIMSLSSICSNFGQISSNRPQNNGTYYTSNYTRPLSGIKGVKVSKLGELGTTKKCTIELQAWTDEQLNEIGKCYFIPGMSVRVQFGWSLNGDGTPGKTPLVDKQGSELTDAKANCLMFNTSISDNPNYDGFQGKITNYSYKLNSDGGWDIVLEIISAASLMSDVKIESFNNKCECQKDDQQETNLSDSGLGIAILKATKDESLVQLIERDLAEEGISVREDVAVVDLNSDARTAEGEDNTGFLENPGAALSQFGGWVANALTFDDQAGAKYTETSGTTETFISLRALHHLINYYSLPSTESGRYVFGKIDTNSNIYISTQGFYKNEGTLELASSDPRICILPGGLNPIPDQSQLTGIPTALLENAPRETRLNGPVIDLTRVLVNTIFIRKTIKDLAQQSEKQKGIVLKDFLTTVYTSINTCLGNLWNFEIVDATSQLGKCTESSDPLLQVVDTSTYINNESSQIEPVTSYNPRTSIVREFNLETKLTEEMKSMALYSSVGPQGTKNPCIDEFKAFSIAGNIENKALPPKAFEAKIREIQCSFAQDGITCKKTDQTPAQKAVIAFEKVSRNLVSENVSGFEAARSEYYASRRQDKNVPSCNMVLPFQWSFTLDGIGGFRFGQYITHPRIPKEVRDSFKFQITSVEHDLSEGDWKTTVNTIARFHKDR